MRYTAQNLRTLPTLAVGQSCDLKIETATERVWLSRCGIADGEPYPDRVSVEMRDRGQWVIAETYRG